MHRVQVKPLSVNDAYKGRRFRTPEYNTYKKSLGFMLPKITLPEPPYEIFLKFGLSSMSADFDNPTKPTIDCIAEKYKFNDKLIQKGTIEKVKVSKGQEYFEFSIIHFKA